MPSTNYNKDSPAVQKAIEAVARTPEITVTELMAAVPELEFPQLWTMVAVRDVHVDLSAAPFSEPANVRVFPSAEALQFARTAAATAIQQDLTALVAIRPNAEFLIDATSYTITRVTETDIELTDSRGRRSRLTVDECAERLRQGRFATVADNDAHSRNLRELFRTRTARELAAASDRFAAIAHRVTARPLEHPRAIRQYSERHQRRMARQFRLAERSGARTGLTALVPRINRGNTVPRVETEVLAIFERVVNEHFANSIRPRANAVYPRFQRECEAVKKAPFSERTFYRRLKLMDRHVLEKARCGEKAALAFAPPAYWGLDVATPVHGDYPWQVGHVDFTPLDILVRCRRTGLPIRPMLCLLLDAFTRRVLAFHLSFASGETIRDVLATLRQCVRRHQRLPEMLVLDNGKAFASDDVTAFCAMFKVVKIARPPGQARYGSVIERFFGTTTTGILNQLPGNTQARRQVRSMTSDVDPAERNDLLAVESLVAVLGNYFFEAYDTTRHSALGVSPREWEEFRVRMHGDRVDQRISYSRELLIATMETAPRQSTVYRRSGIRVQHRDYYCDLFKSHELEGQKVTVKFDDTNAAIVFAKLPGGWEECRCKELESLTHLNQQQLEAESLGIRRALADAKSETGSRAEKLQKLIDAREGLEKFLKDRASAEALLVLNAIPGPGEKWEEGTTNTAEAGDVPPPATATLAQDDGDDDESDYHPVGKET